MISRGQNWTSFLLSLMMVLVPAVGVPHEELLQDTLKSILVAFFALAATFSFFWTRRKQDSQIHWHSVQLLPLALMAYAFGSMAWSHAYLGGVETVRWFLFSLLLFLGINVFTFDRIKDLAWGIHLGAVAASLWAALQFWMGFDFFAQGPNPASTFVNRNFFGEFLVCTLPFTVLLLSRVKDKVTVFLLTFSLGFNVAALMMTGTRSALLGLMLYGILLPIAPVLYGKQFVSTGWCLRHVVAAFTLLFATIAGLGSIYSANPKLIAETGPGNAIDRAFKRTLSMASPTEYSQGSFSIRAMMWKTTAKMIAAHPVIGVGAGAWEVAEPLYQAAGSQLETDYYAHNEILQLLAEYGLAGWLFLLGLIAYLIDAAYRTWKLRCTQSEQEALPRALALASIFVLLLVSNAGFPWRMATTGALFALSLSVLAASDMRLPSRRGLLGSTINWKPRHSVMALSMTAICTGIGLYISQQAILCESKIARAVKIAMTISQSGMPNDPRWDLLKTDMLRLINEGIVINPHYRKLTPIVADNLATWGDWKNATWIWESVLESRPNVVALLANVARGNIQAKDYVKAQDYLDRAAKIQPTAPALAPLQVIIWSQTGRTAEARAKAKELLLAGVAEPDLVRTAYYLGMRTQDSALAILALELRIKTWPNQAVDGWLKLGDIYSTTDAKNEGKALDAYRAALAAALPIHRAAILALIPPTYRDKVQ
jgi:O-antigen ligase